MVLSPGQYMLQSSFGLCQSYRGLPIKVMSLVCFFGEDETGEDWDVYMQKNVRNEH